MCNGVTPSSFLAFIFAPYPMARDPCSAYVLRTLSHSWQIYHEWLVLIRHGPRAFSIKNLATWSYPFCAAIYNGVVSFSFLALMSAPCPTGCVPHVQLTRVLFTNVLCSNLNFQNFLKIRTTFHCIEFWDFEMRARFLIIDLVSRINGTFY